MPKGPEKTTVAEDLRTAARIWGVILLVPGLCLLAFGVWLGLEMFASGVFSLRALLCCFAIGGGLTATGASRLLGSRDDEI